MPTTWNASAPRTASCFCITMIVDTAAFDPAGNDDDFRTLLARIDAMRGPKEFIKLATR